MFDNIYKNKKVLITGNTGFKGAWLSAWLLKLGANVFGISKGVLDTEISLFEVLGLDKKIKHYEQNLKNPQKTQEIIENIKPDFVFHLAAQAIVSTSYKDPLDTFETNIMGTANVLEALRLINQKCIVIAITSDKCYDNVEWKWGYRENDALGGKDPYSASKSGAEIVIKSYYHSFFKSKESNIKICSVRAGNVIGGGDWADNRIVPDAFKAWASKNPVEIRSPKSTRPWQHVLEPLSGYLQAGKILAQNEQINGESYNFGPNSDQDFTVLELLQELSLNWEFVGQEQKIIAKENNTFHEAGLLKLNCDKALFDLKWRPTMNFRQTAKFTATWYREFYQQQNNMFEFTENQITAFENIAKENKIVWTI